MSKREIKGKWQIEYKPPLAKKTRLEKIEDPIQALLAIARLLELRVELITVRFEPDGQ